MGVNTVMKPTVRQLIARGLAARHSRDNVAYALGRFHSVRKAYATGMAASQLLGRRPPLTPHLDTLFPALDVHETVRSLDTTSISLGLRLPPDLVSQIKDLALTSTCQLRHGGVHRFRYQDVRNGRLANNDLAVIGDVLGVEEFEPIDRLARDPNLLDAASRYMGYRPTRVDKWLHWSFACECSDEDRREQGQTIDYHFDVHGYNFVYVAFYLTDCDQHSGAHVLVERSHHEKPLRWLFDTARKSDRQIYQHYGLERERVVIGTAGDGFIEDTSCYHKALAPRDRDRLLLQFRYF